MFNIGDKVEWIGETKTCAGRTIVQKGDTGRIDCLKNDSAWIALSEGGWFGWISTNNLRVVNDPDQGLV